MGEVANPKYSGTAPGADGNTYTIFNSVTAFNGANMAQNAGFKRYMVDMKHSQSGTLNFYYSLNRGTSWNQVYTSGAIAAPASTSSTIRDFAIEQYPDFKLEWVNGGSAQATWSIAQTLTDERASLT